jgi:hypothetical protein
VTPIYRAPMRSRTMELPAGLFHLGRIAGPLRKDVWEGAR